MDLDALANTAGWATAWTVGAEVFAIVWGEEADEFAGVGDVVESVGG